MKRSKPTVARDPIEYHDVMIALSRATGALALLDELTNSDAGLWHPSESGHTTLTDKGFAALGTTRQEARAWTIDMTVRTLADALREARDAFRKSLTPDEAKRQVVEGIGPKAVA